MTIPFHDRLLPAPRRGAFRMPDHWVWCGSSIRGDDGRYHLFASRWPKTVTFYHWATCSEVVRAVADRPEGPYQFEEVVIPRRDPSFWDGMVSHNPTIHFHDGKFLLFYIGSTFRGTRPEEAEEGARFSDQWVEAWNGKRTGLLVSDSVFGPWERRDEPILQPRPGKWDSVITSNPAPCVREDGSVILIYKSTNIRHPCGRFPGRFHQGVARAKNWRLPFERLSDEPIALAGVTDTHIEDGFVWWNGGVYEMVIKDMTGEVCGEEGAAIHATSREAISWTPMQPPCAYSRTVRWDDGTTSTLPRLERPQVLIENGKPTHLFAATLSKDEAGEIEESWNVVIPLR
jgi:hypothetical protein